MLLCGLWFGKSKSPMNLFLKPFVNESISLHGIGFESTTFLNNTPTIINVHTLVSVVDSSARPAILNVKQYNVKYGCPYCLHKGRRIPVGNGFARVFPGDVRKLRNMKQHIKDAKKADGKKATKERQSCKSHTLRKMIGWVYHF